MTHSPFRLIAGGLIATILILTIIAAVLTLSIIDKEVSLRSGEIVWPSATTWRESNTLKVDLTSTGIPMSTYPSPMLIVSTPSPEQKTLPYPHPDVGTNPPPCTACHKNIHGSGG